ncbi:MAG: copper chaperone [Caldilinea sp. CFX5]|nr:copper chaperone [Caldilinea sp. CFX5]
MTKKVFRIPDMHCSACVMRLEGIEDELQGVKRVTASYRKQQMEVEYDETQVTEQEIMAAVERHGYQAAPA